MCHYLNARFEALPPRAGFETVVRQELGSAGKILVATPTISFQFPTDAGMIPPQASRQVAEAEMFFPPPIDQRPFLVIEMTLVLTHTPPPVSVG